MGGRADQESSEILLSSGKAIAAKGKGGKANCPKKPDDKAREPQFAALPYRLNDRGKIEVLLISSRDTGRWIIPKGWPIEGRTGPETAEIEAYEEAGIRGKAGTEPLGTYDYIKREQNKSNRPCRVTVFAFHVLEDLSEWPEKSQRRQRWFPPGKAASKVDEPELAAIIRAFKELAADILTK